MSTPACFVVQRDLGSGQSPRVHRDVVDDAGVTSAEAVVHTDVHRGRGAARGGRGGGLVGDAHAVDVDALRGTVVGGHDVVPRTGLQHHTAGDVVGVTPEFDGVRGGGGVVVQEQQ